MKIEALPYLFSICKLKNHAPSLLNNDFTFYSSTDREISLLCKTQNVPKDTLEREDGWRGYRIAGNLDFSLVGILADISSALAESNIPIFAVSTFNTDYFFMKNKYSIKAVAALKNKGYEL